MTVDESWAAPERETVINMNDSNDLVRIWTAQLPVIRRLSADPRFQKIGEGEHWAEFTIPAARWNPVTGAKRKGVPLSPERRAAALAALAKGRTGRL